MKEADIIQFYEAIMKCPDDNLAMTFKCYRVCKLRGFKKEPHVCGYNFRIENRGGQEKVLRGHIPFSRENGD